MPRAKGKRQSSSIIAVALTRFKRSLKWARPSIRQLTHTLYLPPAESEIYDRPHAEWLREILEKLPKLQSLIVPQLPVFDHASLLALQARSTTRLLEAEDQAPAFALRLLIATQCLNTTPRSLEAALTSFPNLVYIDLSWTLGARDPSVLDKLQYMQNLQILKLRGIQLRDDDTETLAKSIKTRVRSLDVRSNLLTDRSVRTLLHFCFPAAGEGDGTTHNHPGALSGAAEEDWPSSIVRPDPALLDEFRDVSFDERYYRRLTTSVVSRLPFEDQPHSGITHLAIADNYLTVEGLSSLVKDAKLYVLDAGNIETTKAFRRPRSSSKEVLDLQNGYLRLPSTEKLVPLLEEHASKILTCLRLDHCVVTKQAPMLEQEPLPEPYELDESSASGKVNASIPTYELSNEEPPERFELPGDPVRFIVTPAMGKKPGLESTPSSPIARRESIYAPEVVDEENESPARVSTSLDNVSQTSNTKYDDRSRPEATVTATSPEPSLRSLERRRRELRDDETRRPHGLLPGMVPKVRILTLTGVPSFTNDTRIIDSLKNFVRSCAAEHELAALEAQMESQYTSIPSHNHPKLRQRTVQDIFALRTLMLEMGPPSLPDPSINSPLTPPTTHFPHRTKSSTEDPDSEAFWTAQENDFSFFDDDNEECGLPSTEPVSHFPVSALAEKITLPTTTPSTPPMTPNTKSNPNAALDVIQSLITFRKERRAAFERSGHEFVEGYWPGEVKIVRWRGRR